MKLIRAVTGLLLRRSVESMLDDRDANAAMRALDEAVLKLRYADDVDAVLKAVTEVKTAAGRLETRVRAVRRERKSKRAPASGDSGA